MKKRTHKEVGGLIGFNSTARDLVVCVVVAGGQLARSRQAGKNTRRKSERRLPHQLAKLRFLYSDDARTYSGGAVGQRARTHRNSTFFSRLYVIRLN